MMRVGLRETIFCGKHTMQHENRTTTQRCTYTQAWPGLSTKFFTPPATKNNNQSQIFSEQPISFAAYTLATLKRKLDTKHRAV